MKYIQKRLNHFIGEAIMRYGMIEDGDRILVAVSGGKDSLTLLWFLRERLKWIPIKYSLIAVYVDLGFNEESGKRMEDFFRENGFEYRIIRTNIAEKAKKSKKSPCFLCSRMRKKVLFETADKLGCQKIAVAHNRDDVIETFFLNLFYGASISTMLPVQEFFNGRFKIIRPLYMADERLIKRCFKTIGWKEIDTGCPFSKETKRSKIREFLEKVYLYDRRIKENIFHALHNVREGYLPSYIS